MVSFPLRFTGSVRVSVEMELQRALLAMGLSVRVRGVQHSSQPGAGLPPGEAGGDWMSFVATGKVRWAGVLVASGVQRPGMRPNITQHTERVSAPARRTVHPQMSAGPLLTSQSMRDTAKHAVTWGQWHPGC